MKLFAEPLSGRPAKGSAALDPFPELVGESPPMLRLKAELYRLARIEAPILVRGESGSGKELAAAALHRASGRAHRPYVAVNCAAIPRELLEAELFGCEPGAFTGARKREGFVPRADRGTLFLDEVGELSLSAQAVLLRVLESGEFVPVGGERPRRADFRLVCATHRDLRQMVRAGAFRLDLYHRISALVVEVPPLRARTSDLPALCRALLGPEGPTLSRAAVERLASHGWPGNVRELRNVLVRAVASLDDGPGAAVHPEDLCIETWEAADHAGTSPGVTGPPGIRSAVGALVRLEVDRQSGNVRAAARALGVSHTTIYRHLRGLELAAPGGQ